MYYYIYTIKDQANVDKYNSPMVLMGYIDVIWPSKICFRSLVGPVVHGSKTRGAKNMKKHVEFQTGGTLQQPIEYIHLYTSFVFLYGEM